MDYNITYRQKDKGWQFIISYKVNGKWKQKSKQGFKSKKEAKPIADKMLNELKKNENLNVELHDITFGEFVDMYMEHIKLHLEKNTIDSYYISLQYFKKIYDIEMKNIRTLHIQNCIDEMIKINLSPETIKIYSCKIASIFNSAVKKYNIISKSPCTNIELKSKKEPSTKKALTESELKDLLNKTKNMKYKVIFSLAGMCGLRIGEILGLKWNKIDFKNDLITIDIQWKNLKDGTIGFGDLKSKNSYRTIPMPPYVKKLLLEWKKYHPIDISNRVVFYKGSNLSYHFSKKIKEIGYNISIHELRHTYATTLIANGIDFKTVAKLMGHDVKQTMQTYSHVTSDMMNNAANLINKIF